MKHLQFGRGPTTQEDGIVGLQGELRVDTTRNEVRVHDGVTVGGHRIPTLETVQSLLAQQTEGGEGKVVLFSNLAELANATPDAGVVAVVTGVGFEDSYIWRSGAGDQGTVTSAIQGHWRLLDSSEGLIIRMWRAGLINLQVEGTTPVVDQDTTVWINSGVVKLWDGAAYQFSTPALFGRLIGQNLDVRLASTLTDVADLNLATLGSGWYRTTAGAVNAPLAGVHAFEHRKIDATNAVQILWIQGSATQNRYQRFLTAGVWGAWTQIAGQLPNRLAASAASSISTDANTITDNGFYEIANTGLHIPAASNATLIHVQYDAANAMQLWLRADADELWTRRLVASAWQSWVQISTNTTTLAAAIAGLTAKTTLVGADGIVIQDSTAGLAGKFITWANLFLALGPMVAAATTKTTPVTGDKLLMSNSAAANAPVSLDWADLLVAIAFAQTGRARRLYLYDAFGEF